MLLRFGNGWWRWGGVLVMNGEMKVVKVTMVAFPFMYLKYVSGFMVSKEGSDRYPSEFFLDRM